ncbi:hypothetical protein [Bradyrhizobium viridifuturi]|uniref:hypothetical protein n=1 Tax=Bradyrhizobium viridifuturi TaxID=1654716 RepID=UPI00067EA10D|nr:hypothetical protein [Bradyrhizobium viridifuturi]
MKARLSALNLLVHAHNNPESAVADALDGILNPGIRKHAGTNSAPVDWVTAGCISFIATVCLPHDDATDEPTLPLWPTGTLR